MKDMVGMLPLTKCEDRLQSLGDVGDDTLSQL